MCTQSRGTRRGDENNSLFWMHPGFHSFGLLLVGAPVSPDGQSDCRSRDQLRGVCENCHTQVPQMGGLKQQKCLFSQFRGLDVKIKALAGWFFSEAPLLGLQLAVSSLSSHSLPSVPTCVPISSSYNTHHIGCRPTVITSFNLNSLFKDRISK